MVYKPIAASQGLAAQFEAQWQRQIVSERGAAATGSTVAHYRGRLPGGVDACFMGRWFERAVQDKNLYSVMYVLEPGERTQTIVASVIGSWDGVNFPAAIDGSAHWALSQQLFPLLDSIKVPHWYVEEAR